MIGRLRAVVPFPERACGIAARLEEIGQRGFVWIEPSRSLAHAADSRAEMGAPREELGAGGSAHRAHVEILERRPVLRERIDIRGRQIRVSVSAQIAPTLVICQKDDEIRTPLFGREGTGWGQDQQPGNEAEREAESIHGKGSH